jgi:hypothetical protein
MWQDRGLPHMMVAFYWSTWLSYMHNHLPSGLPVPANEFRLPGKAALVVGSWQPAAN